MDTASKPRLRGLDHLRALAISLVFLFHYGMFGHPEWVVTSGKFGWTGVDLFFVLSGYLIASQLFLQVEKSKAVLLKPFFLKRFFRIIPAYLVVVGIYFLFPVVHEREALAPLWKFLTFTQNLGLDLRTQGTFSHAWSLCIEEQFYFLLPVILTGLVYIKAWKKGYWLLPALFIMGIFIRLFLYQVVLPPERNSVEFILSWYKGIYYPTYCRLDGLLVGVGIAAFLQYKPVQAKKVLQLGNWLLLIGAVLLMVAYLICLEEQSLKASVFGFPMVSIGYGVWVLAALSPHSMLYRLQWGATKWIAALSYSIYLTHKFIIHLTQVQLGALGVDINGNLVLFACIFTVLAGAWILNKLVEKPFLKLREKILRNQYSHFKTEDVNVIAEKDLKIEKAQ